MKEAILLIDDTEDKRNILISALEKEFSEIDVEIIAVTIANVAGFFPKKGSAGAVGLETDAPEDQLCFFLESNPHIKLVIVDHDLSLLNAQISESVVASACQNAGVPHCRYSRTTKHQTPRQKLVELVERSQIYSIKINISDIGSEDIHINLESIKTIRSIFDGFNKLRYLVAESDENTLQKGPSYVLADILGYPGLDYLFQQYANSYTVFSEVLKIFAILDEDIIEPAEKNKLIKKRLTYTLGFWLANVILKYPGIILNSTSASSFLNLDENTFLTHKDIFSKAKYSGPFDFSSPHGFWWRHELDDILIDSEKDDGLSLLSSLGVNDIKESTCYITGKSPAGYYCLFEKKPISLSASIGALNWMPSGADLSRVQREAYEEVAPLLGY